MEKYTVFLGQWLHIVKASILPKPIYRVNIIPIKISEGVFAETELNLKFVRDCKEPRITKTTLKNKVGGRTPSDFKSYYKTTVIKTVWWRYKDRWRDQRDRIKGTKESRNQHLCEELIFNKSESHFSGEMTNFGTGKSGYTTHNEKNWSYIVLYTKITSKWILDLNI